MTPIQYVKVATLKKGRVSTTVNLFMLDADIFDAICLAYIKGETNIVETRVGVAIKHPKDVYNKAVAKEEALKRLTKQKLLIEDICSSDILTNICTSDFSIIKYKDSGKIIIQSNI